MADVIPMEKFNGKTLEEIEKLVNEYAGFHKIVDSADPNERVNLVNKRNDELGKVRQGLEGIVSKELGDKEYADKPTADKIVEILVAKGYEAHKIKLAEDSKKKEEAISKYLASAGVDYTQLVKDIINTRKPTNVAELPDNHPLKTLVTYITNQLNDEARRIQYITQKIVSLGDVHAPAIAEAFNKYGGLRLDKRFAKPQEAIQTYSQIVQAKLAEYAAKDPNAVYNKAEIKKAA